MRLLKTQKNELFGIIEEVGLSPSSFFFNDPDAFSNLGTEIGFKNSNFRFNILARHDNQDLVVLSYSPAESSFNREEWVTGWTNIVKHFRIWGNTIYDEITTIDKWERLKDEIGQISFSFKDETNKFSASEYEDLKIKMQLLKLEIRQLGLQQTQLVAIEKKLDNLTEIGLTLSKFDWKSLFVGTIISIIIQLAVTQENARAIWSVIKKIFNTYFLP